ncbi:MAG TPA: hypothetical protein VGI74_22020 [Streptosporangiaceae bacterium]|jgi:hypothetical protein
MQALTLAISPAGVAYFTQQYAVKDLSSALSKLSPPDRRPQVPDFWNGPFTLYSNIAISLSNGKLTGFNPAYQSVTQEPGGKFKVILLAGSFTAEYAWHEKYREGHLNPKIGWKFYDRTGDFTYRPQIGSLTTTVDLAFVYNQSTQSYDIQVVKTNGTPANVTANIPGQSVLQNEEPGCLSSHVKDSTAEAISAIDFSQAISRTLGPLLHTIPASGQLTQDIRYEFAVGDSGITFPGDKGIAIGATGRVSYKEKFYPEPPPPPLPVPPVPAGDHHLQAYVSDYEINALHWAFFEAGLLNTTVRPADLPNPDVLKVKTYVNLIPAFKPYGSFAMTASIKPRQPPVNAFQQVWEFTVAAMDLLMHKLPANVYQLIKGLEGDGYVSLQDLKDDLAAAGVAETYYPAIEDATKAMGMVVTQNLGFTLTIENGADPQPNLVFDVNRTDILRDLGLGETGGAQTLKYTFRPVKSKATFVSTTVPNFDSRSFGDIIWPVAGEPRYTDTLQKMGETGVPIPIMAGFHFLFKEAILSIQQGYVSILAQVAPNRTAFMSDPARRGRAGGEPVRPVWQGFRVLTAAKVS